MESFPSGPAATQGRVHDHQGFYALVSYIPDPLGGFLNSLRSDLVNGCRLRSHVTLLPPRLLRPPSSVLIQELERRTRMVAPFEITLGEIECFETTSVIYIAIERGWKQMLESHDFFSEGILRFEEHYPFHPHLTLAQDVPGARFEQVLDRARHSWSHCPYPKTFEVKNLTFVQNVHPNRWDTLSEHTLSGTGDHTNR